MYMYHFVFQKRDIILNISSQEVRVDVDTDLAVAAGLDRGRLLEVVVRRKTENVTGVAVTVAATSSGRRSAV